MPSWIESLKKWNEGKGAWCIPRKGSEAYLEVRKLMNPGEEPAVPKKAPKVPAEIREMIRNAKDDYDSLDMRDKATVLGALEKYNLRAPTVMKKDFHTWMTSRAQEKAVMAAAAPKPALRKITSSTDGRRYEETPEEKATYKAAQNKKELSVFEYQKDNWKTQSKDDRISAYSTIEGMNLPVPPIMKRGYETWVEDGRPSTYKTFSPRLTKKLVGNVEWERQGKKTTSVPMGFKKTTGKGRDYMEYLDYE